MPNAHYLGVAKRWLFTDMGSNNGICDIQYRPATQEEINKATGKEKIMVGEFDVVFGNNGFERNTYSDYVRVGCVEVQKELFLKIGKRAGWL